MICSYRVVVTYVLDDPDADDDYDDTIVMYIGKCPESESVLFYETPEKAFVFVSPYEAHAAARGIRKRDGTNRQVDVEMLSYSDDPDVGWYWSLYGVEAAVADLVEI